MTPLPVTATILGAPRIGPNRELKRAVEKYWAGAITRAELESVAADLRHESRAALAAGGLDSIPVNIFSYYDQLLDTAVLLGALPPRVAVIEDDLDRYFAAARGTATIAPLEMTKWFDTNYHYIVPEIGPDTTFSLHPEKVLNELKEAQAQGIPARPVLVGPITFLALSKAVDGAGSPIGRLDELVAVYGDLLGLLADAGAGWVQLDEPILVTDQLDNAAELAERVYTTLASAAGRPAIFVATYFGALDGALPALARTPVEAIGVDLVAGGVQAVAAVPELAHKQARRGASPNPERQIHRACGDIRAALLGALELLSGTTVPRAGRDDVLPAFSDLGRVQHHVALALHATHLLDQMVGTPAEHRQPWSYYRGRIGKKLRPVGRQLDLAPETGHRTNQRPDAPTVAKQQSRTDNNLTVPHQDE